MLSRKRRRKKIDETPPDVLSSIVLGAIWGSHNANSIKVLQTYILNSLRIYSLL